MKQILLPKRTAPITYCPVDSSTGRRFDILR